MPEEGPWYEEGKKITELLASGFLIALVGKRGTGKTLMGIKILLAGINRLAVTGMYYTAMDVFLKLRHDIHHNYSQLDTVNDLVSPKFLVIDAMEVRGETKFENQILDHMIDKRYSNLKDTLLISNQTKDEFIKSAGPSIISRLKETGGIVECNWESFR